MGETATGCIVWRGFLVALLVGGCATARGARPHSEDGGRPMATRV
jgi:hypothetical protein